MIRELVFHLLLDCSWSEAHDSVMENMLMIVMWLLGEYFSGPKVRKLFTFII